MQIRVKRAILFPAILAAGVATMVFVPVANADTVISSSAYGVGSNLNVLHVVNASIGPVASVAGSAPAPYDASKTVLSVKEDVGLGILKLTSFGEHLKTGVIKSTASSPYTATPTGTANSTIDGLSSDLRSELLGHTLLDILGINAKTISSTSSVSAFGSPMATGSSIIEGLTLNGSAFGHTTFDASVLANADPNTVLFDLAGLKIVLNEQLFSGDGISSAGVITNAIDVTFNNFLLGANLLSGNLTIGHSQASITGFVPPPPPPGNPGGVPEPAVWAELLAGFGLAGSVMRRRRGQTVLA